MNKPLIPPSDPAAQRMLAQMQQRGQVVDVAIVPRLELREAIAKAIAQLNVIRGQLIGTAANLERIVGMVQLAEGQLRAASLGRLPAGIDEREIPTPQDLADVRGVFDMLCHLVNVLGEGARATPFAEPIVGTGKRLAEDLGK